MHIMQTCDVAFENCLPACCLHILVARGVAGSIQLISTHHILSEECHDVGLGGILCALGIGLSQGCVLDCLGQEVAGHVYFRRRPTCLAIDWWFVVCTVDSACGTFTEAVWRNMIQHDTTWYKSLWWVALRLPQSSPCILTCNLEMLYTNEII
jgi:hypothetical protein